MAIDNSTAAIGALALGGPLALGALPFAGPIHQISEANNARREAENERKKQAESQAVLEAELRDKENEGANIKIRDQQRARQKAKQGAIGGRSGTILTGPLGVGSAPISNPAPPPLAKLTPKSTSTLTSKAGNVGSASGGFPLNSFMQIAAGLGAVDPNAQTDFLSPFKNPRKFF